MIIMFFTILSCADKPCVDCKPPVGLLKNQIIQSDGLERAYHLYVPEDYSNQALVILLHGNRSSHDDMIGEGGIKAPHKVWLTIAAQENFLVAIPNGTLGVSNNRGWNDCRSDALGNPTVDDVAFIESLLSSIQTDYDFDANRVYAAGISNGGHMAYRLAQELSEKITAFASIAASIAENADCVNSTIPVSALFMNGTADSIMPYLGGDMATFRGRVLSTTQSVDYWVTRNGTSSTPTMESLPNSNLSDSCIVNFYLFGNGANNTEVALYEVINGGHTEPSIEERYSNLFLQLVGNQNGDIEMARVIWNFFKTKSK